MLVESEEQLREVESKHIRSIEIGQSIGYRCTFAEKSRTERDFPGCRKTVKIPTLLYCLVSYA